MADDFYWPRPDEHVAVVGRNGTGKSQLGFFLLALRDHKKRITYALDYKREELFRRIKHARYVQPKEPLAKEPGLYVVQAIPEMDDEAVDGLLWRILDREKMGLFADEGYMLPNDGKSRPFKAILTQGRAKRIPVITLSQRPVGVTPFAFSEASHVVGFHLNDREDRKVIERRAGSDFFDGIENLPEFNSKWYSVKKNRSFIIRPVPPADEIAASIDAQLVPVRRWF